MNFDKGILIDKTLHDKLREKFAYLDEDPILGSRLFFENSGGSLRLKSSIEVKNEIDLLPDCPERTTKQAKIFNGFIEKAKKDIINTVFGADKGTIMTELTASQTMFQGIATIMGNIEGTNAVTTNIEHPSAYDSLKFYCNKYNKEFRVIEVDKKTGFIEVEEVLKKIDKDTILLSIIASSNISGNVMNLEKIISEVKKINPNIYIVVDAVQHVPHSIIDVKKLNIDFINFAPYKFYGSRGIGFAYLSDRLSKLPHHKLLEKPKDTWMLGSPTPSLFASFIEVVDYVCEIGMNYIESSNRRELYCAGMNAIRSHERALHYRLLEGSKEQKGLRYLDGVQVLLDNESLKNKDLIVPINFVNRDLTQVVEEYYKNNVIVFERVNTSIYSKRIVEAMGFEGIVRVSPTHVHNFKDIDKFLKITEEIIKN